MRLFARAMATTHLLRLPRMPVLLTLTLCFLLSRVCSDFASDRAECADQLVGLATCLTYAQRTDDAKAPTPDCCAHFKKVVAKSFKCLCVLIKDRDAPELGIKVNVNRCLTLPSACNAPANVSDCPSLLKLPPNSTEAAVFRQFGSALQGTATISTAAHNSTGGGTNMGAQQSNGGSMKLLAIQTNGWMWTWHLLSSLVVVASIQPQ